ncbi:MAG: hypothetical protein ACRCZF_13395, partial [Gemmataceae bacterium]
MKRTRTLMAALAGVVLSGLPLEAQTPATSPLELVRGLRESGLPELSLEYLAKLEREKPSQEILTIIPLERAKVQLALATQES